MCQAGLFAYRYCPSDTEQDFKNAVTGIDQAAAYYGDHAFIVP